MIRVAIALLLLASAPAQAVEILFFGIQRSNGSWLELEKGSRMVHLAISYQGGWLHAHPLTGVAVSYELQAYGKIIAHASNSEADDPSEQRVEPWVGLKYDHGYRWNDEAFYCSELVGKLLGLAPRPMDFSAPVWQGRVPSTDLGISPQGVYNDLSKLSGWSVSYLDSP